MGIHIPIKHIAESAAILEIPDVHFDMVRSREGMRCTITARGHEIRDTYWPSDEKQYGYLYKIPVKPERNLVPGDQVSVECEAKGVHGPDTYRISYTVTPT